MSRNEVLLGRTRRRRKFLEESHRVTPQNDWISGHPQRVGHDGQISASCLRWKYPKPLPSSKLAGAPSLGKREA